MDSFKVSALPGIGVTFARPVIGLPELEIRTEGQAGERLSSLGEYINGLSRLKNRALNAGAFFAGAEVWVRPGLSLNHGRLISEKEAQIATAKDQAIKQMEEIRKLRFQERRLVMYVE